MSPNGELYVADKGGLVSCIRVADNEVLGQTCLNNTQLNRAIGYSWMNIVPNVKYFYQIVSIAASFTYLYVSYHCGNTTSLLYIAVLECITLKPLVTR